MVRETRRKDKKILRQLVNEVVFYTLHIWAETKRTTVNIWDVNLVMVGDVGKFSDFEM